MESTHFPFAFAWLKALQAVRHSLSLSDPVICYITQAKQRLTVFKKIIDQQLKSKELNAMMAFTKLLVLFVIFLPANLRHAFMILSSASEEKQDWVNHLVEFEESMSKPTNEPSCEPVHKPTNDQMNYQTLNQTKHQLEQDALLPDNLSFKKVMF